jgi:predicted DNA-binding transcriptional regulator YafY
MPELNPTARALLALELIQGRPGITGAELAAQLGVSDRAARRYVGVLRDAGIPVESTTGPYGGYRIGRGARVPPLMFSTTEALGLVMAVLQGWHGPVDSGTPAADALAKIVRVLPAAAAGPAEALRRVVAQNPGDAAAVPDPAVTAAVARACETRAQQRLRYRTGRGSEHDMVVDPWAVVVRHGRWYVLCWSHTSAARRALRLDRVVDPAPTGQTYPVPELDPVAAVEEHLADGWAYPVEVRFAVPLDLAVQCVPRTLGRLRADGPAASVLTGSTDEPPWYAAQLAATELPFTVLSGSPEIRAELRALAARLTGAAG